MIDVTFVRARVTREADPATQCTFCLRRRDEVRQLVTGPGVSICDACIDLAKRTLRRHGAVEFRRWWDWRRPRVASASTSPSPAYRDAPPHCSFCRLERAQMIRAEHAVICSPCVKLSADIIAEHLAAPR